MVVMQIIGVNVQLYFNCRFLKLNFWYYVRHQFLSILLLLVISAFAMLVVDKIFVIQDRIIIRFLLSGILYAFIVIGLVYFQPLLFGLKKNDLSVMAKYLLQIIKK
jgi:hypothetical protein